MGFFFNRIKDTIIDSGNKLGSVCKAKYKLANGQPYHNSKYFISDATKSVYVVNYKCGSSSIKRMIMEENGLTIGSFDHYGLIHNAGKKKGFERITTKGVEDYYFGYVPVNCCYTVYTSS